MRPCGGVGSRTKMRPAARFGPFAGPGCGRRDRLSWTVFSRHPAEREGDVPLSGGVPRISHQGRLDLSGPWRLRGTAQPEDAHLVDPFVPDRTSIGDVGTSSGRVACTCVERSPYSPRCSRNGPSPATSTSLGRSGCGVLCPGSVRSGGRPAPTRPTTVA